MSRRSLSWLPLLVVVSLVLQGVLPVLLAFAPPVALAAEDAPPVLTTPPAPAGLAAPQPFTSPLPTPEPTPTATPPVPTPEPRPAPPAARHLNLSLAADPPWAAPGEAVTFTLTATNPISVPLPGLALTTTLPAGLIYVAQSARGFVYTPSAKTLTWPAGDPSAGSGQALAAGAVITGSFQARVQGVALGATVTNTVTATSPALAVPLTAEAVLDIVSPRNNETWAAPGAGGVLRTTDDRVLLRVPPGAVAARTRFVYTPQASVPVPLAHLRAAFTLAAYDEAGAAVRQFAPPLALTWADPAAPDRLTLHYFDEATQQWRARPAQWEHKQRQVRAALPHLTLFAVTGATVSYGVQLLPGVRGFASDTWTGNSSVHYPLRLPPGPGGLALALSLDYTSETVNSLRAGAGLGLDEGAAKSFSVQASAVGWGWRLNGLGRINVTDSGQRAFLEYAGGSFELFEQPGSPGYWQTEPQSFLRIQHSGPKNLPGPWVVWTPDGRKYTFGGPENNSTGVATWFEAPFAGETECKRRVREMHLVEVADLHGNRVMVNYAREQRQVLCPAEGTDRPFYDRAIYPTSLAYYARNEPLATAVVTFGYGGRTDTAITDWDNQCVQSLWSTVRLGDIHIQLRTGSGAGELTTIRRYQLTHTYLWYWSNPTNQQGLLLLQGITEYGREGGARPTWGFTYVTPSWDWWNYTLLQTADNGQGGRVTYTYNTATIPIGGASCGGPTYRFRVQELLTEDGLGQAAHNRSTTTYQYANPQAWTTDPASGPTCRNRFEFLGHGQVQRQTRDGAGALLQTVVETFHQCHPGAPPASCTGSAVTLDPRKGQTYAQTTLDPAERELTRTRTAWATETVQGRTWVFQAAVTQWRDGGAPHKTEYAYLPAQQGGVQYGNLTHVREYSDEGATLYRTQVTTYYPRNDPGGVYLVNRPAQQVLQDAAGACQGETRTWYDLNPAYTQAPTQGDPTRIQVAQTSCGGTWRETAYTYDAWGNRLTVTDPRGYPTTTAYDTSGGWPKLFAYPTSVTPPAVNGQSFTTRYAWDKAVGQVTQATDPNGAVTSYGYDQWGRVTQLWQPGDDQASGHAATQVFVYTDYGGPGAPFKVQQRQRDDPAGGAAAATYQESYTFYDGLGQVIQTQAEGATPAQGVLTSTQYDALGRVTRQTVPYFGPATGVYQPLADWAGKSTTTTYDALGRVTRLTAPDGTWTDTVYNGRQTAVLDALGRQTIQEVDAFGRRVSVKLYTGVYGKNPPAPNWQAAPYAQSDYEYTVTDQLDLVRGPDPDGAGPQGRAVSDPSYDLLGRKTAMTDPDLGTWQYTYDAASNLVTQTDARGVSLWFGYDGLGRLTEQRAGGAGGPLLTRYIYDESQAGYSHLGRRTGAEAYTYPDDWDAAPPVVNTLAARYDARGRVAVTTRTVDGVSYTTQYAYDAADRVVRVTYPDGEQVTTTYDARGQPGSLTSNQLGVLADTTSYDAAARLTSLRYPAGSGLVRRQVYYPWTQQGGRLQQLLVGTSATTANRLNLAYTYDAGGNVASSSDNGVLSSFSYDDLDRLRTAYGQSFTYDAAGRLTNFAGLAYTPDSGHPHAVNLVNGVDRYDYDLNGNQILRHKGVPNQEQYLTWDAANRLAGVTYTNRPASGGNPPPTTCNGVPCKRVYLPFVSSLRPHEQYSYDADGARVRKATATEVTRTIGPHYEVVVAVGSGQVLTTTKYYAFGGQRIAVRQNGTLSYLHSDHLGSTAVTTNNSGATTNSVRYHAYGGQRSGNLLALPTDHAFTGQKLDRGTGLLYYGARYYDSALGMFISPDTIVPEPANPQSLNRYAYVLNNPLRYTDPTGHNAACAPLMGGGPLGVLAALGCEVGYAVASYGPQLIQLATNLSQFAASPQGQVALQLAQQANAGLNQAASNVGNAAGSGGLGPNDPWDKFNELLRQGKSEIDAAVQASTQGSGDRFVIGKYVSPEEFQRTGQMGYIQEVQARGGRYFDAGKTLWARLEKGGMAGEVNRQVIRRQMETGINRIELAGETIQQALSRKGSWTVEEIKWIREFARVFGYVEDATGWTKGP